MEAGGAVIDNPVPEDTGTVIDFESSDGTVILPEAATHVDGQAAPPPPPTRNGGPLVPGQQFSKRYLIVELLGLGGMGAVYKAWDSELEIVVAIKVIRPEAAAKPEMAAELDRRFKRELLLAREVTHRNVVRIHDLGEIEGIKYITMSYVDGEDLATLLKRKHILPVSEALRITRDVVSGLVAAHEAGVVHRDLKPANIMIAKTSGEAVIMDFGIARSSGGPAPTPDTAVKQAGGRLTQFTHAQTMVGAVVGTFEYMAPEQLEGTEVDQRADLYTMGLILYDMLLGRPRIKSAHSAVSEAHKRARKAPPQLREENPDVPEPLDNLITRCLQPEAEDRYETTLELAEELDRLDDEGHLKPIKRLLTGKMMLAAATLVIALLAGTWWLAMSRAPQEAPEPMSILIADFDNQTGDSTFDGALEQTLSIAMEGAGFINSYPRPNAQEVAEELMQDRALDETMARLVSRREGIDVILAGTLTEKGSGYRITAHALDAALESADSKPLAKASATADDKEDVLPAVGRLASDLRRRLGDTQPESARLAEAETFTAASPDAMRAYAVGQELAFQGRHDEAVQSYQQAIAFDPEFGRAYAGLAVVYYNLGESDKSQDYFGQAMARIDRMTEREKSRTRGGYYLMVGNHQQAAEEYETLVERYPADSAGHANLALAYFFQRDMSRALEEGGLAVDLNPKNVPQRNNMALYAMYAGDFESAAQEAQAVIDMNPAFAKAYIARGVSELGQGHPEQARETYGELEQVSARGASFAATGLGDLALFEGKNANAVAILEQGIAGDLANGFGYDAAVKTVALAEAHLATGDRDAAVETANEAVEMRRSLGVVVPAARVLLAAGEEERALDLARELSERLEPDPQAYALVLEGEARLAGGDPRAALSLFIEAQELADTWLGRFDLGRAYLELDAYTEAHTALDACLERRGESTAVFLDDRPSFRYFPPTLYYLGRAQEGLGSPAASASYSEYIAIKEDGDRDPLLEDARRRLETFPAAATGS